MSRRYATVSLLLSILGLFQVIANPPSALADDPQIADMAGEWEITYTNDAIRKYSIDKDGAVSFAAEKVKGRIVRKGEALLLAFGQDQKRERLTMGVDGRLFIEHFLAPTDLVGKKPAAIGIGIRQK